jgi:hypothetical protein
MVRAATAPMLFVDPTAVMHRPTFSADGVAVTTFVYVVDAVVVTVTLVSVPAARFLPCTTKPLADSDVTLPLAPPNPPPNAPLLPLGRGLGLKLGLGVPPGLPNPPPPNPPPNPAAPVHVPLVGVLMVTVVAVTDVAGVPLAVPAGGWPNTLTQLPTATSFAVVDTVSVIGVLLVKVTVTCPLVGFCTSMLDPDTAAAVPVTPGKAAAALVGAGLAPLLLAAAGVLVAALPQPAVTSATAPRPTRAGIQPRRQFPLVADARLVVAPIMVGSQSSWLVIRCTVSHSLRSASMGASLAARVAG